MDHRIQCRYGLNLLSSDVQNGRSKTRKLVLLWSIRDSSTPPLLSRGAPACLTPLTGQVEWISNALTNALELAPSSLEIAVRIFVTGRQNATPIPLTMTKNSSYSMTTLGSSTPNTSTSPQSLTEHPSVQITQGRPNIRALLRGEVDNATGRLSVTGMVLSGSRQKIQVLTRWCSLRLGCYCQDVPRCPPSAFQHSVIWRTECRSSCGVFRLCLSFYEFCSTYHDHPSFDPRTRPHP